jgi:hypothetical protein
MLKNVGDPVLIAIREAGDLIPFFGLHRCKILKIQAGAKALAFAGDHDGPYRGFCGQPIDGVGHGRDHVKA